MNNSQALTASHASEYNTPGARVLTGILAPEPDGITIAIMLLLLLDGGIHHDN